MVADPLCDFGLRGSVNVPPGPMLGWVEGMVFMGCLWRQMLSLIDRAGRLALLILIPSGQN